MWDDKHWYEYSLGDNLSPDTLLRIITGTVILSVFIIVYLLNK